MRGQVPVRERPVGPAEWERGAEEVQCFSPGQRRERFGLPSATSVSYNATPNQAMQLTAGRSVPHADMICDSPTPAMRALTSRS